MPNLLRDISETLVDNENGLIFEKNVSIPTRQPHMPVRANIYRPSDTSRQYPVLITYGPYGKDIKYEMYAVCFAKMVLATDAHSLVSIRLPTARSLRSIDPNMLHGRPLSLSSGASTDMRLSVLTNEAQASLPA